MAKQRAVKRQPAQVELRPIRRQIAKDMKRLQAAIAKRKAKAGRSAKSAAGYSELQLALSTMKRWESDIQSICGSNMSLPIA